MKTESERRFKGPLFIVGLSRSGTKLLRDLINQHSEIAITPSETHFIPYVLKHSPQYSWQAELSTNSLKWFARIIVNSKFHADMSRRGVLLSAEEIMQLCRGLSAPDAVEAVLRLYASHNSSKHSFIWGDKTPTNILHMEVLKQAYPSARFIHIVRDPRDRALSAKKAWGADIFLSAIEWREKIAVADKISGNIGDSYVEIKYEDLLKDPRKILSSLCVWLGVEFEEQMLFLDAPAEKLGAAGSPTRTSTMIIAQNIGKYVKEFSTSQTARIEALVYPLLKQKAYSSCFNISEQEIMSVAERNVRRVRDYFNKLRFFIRKFGIVKGVRYSFHIRVAQKSQRT